MEAFLIVLIFLVALASYFIVSELRKISSTLDLISKTCVQSYGMVDVLKEDVSDIEKLVNTQNEILIQLLRSQEKQMPAMPMSPIKPNNWDSMKAAFRGPARVEVNE